MLKIPLFTVKAGHKESKRTIPIPKLYCELTNIKWYVGKTHPSLIMETTRACD